MTAANPTELALVKALASTVTTRALAPRLQTAIQRSVSVPGCKGDWIDSHAIAELVYAERLAEGKFDSTLNQTRDYVQHLFRELYWCCRYATERYYFVHPHKECTPECRARRIPERYLDKPEPRPVCPSCFIETTTQGTCSIGCDDE